LQHVLSNGIALVLIGILLERLAGHARFAAIFAVSALSGSVLSLIVNPLNVVGVGASGGIVGLFAATFVVSLRVASETARKSVMRRAAYTAVLMLVPSGGSAPGFETDYAAHFGGAIGGAAAAFLLFRSWPQDRSNLRIIYGASAAAAAYFVVAAFAVIPVRQQHDLLPLYKELTPNWPTNREEAKRRAPAVIAEHPRDPRAHLARAVTLVESRDLNGAEKEMRDILADREMLTLPLFHALERDVRLLLSGLLLDLRERDQAQDVARPLCGRALPPKMQERFNQMGLCDGRG
jgi:rhomboid protease GluP